MTPDQYCQEKCAASGSCFYYSFLFLPPNAGAPSRRSTPSAAKSTTSSTNATTRRSPRPSSPGGARKSAALAGGQPQHPVGAGAAAAAARFDLPTEQLLEIIDGMEMDLQQTRYPDFKALQLYCYRVASVVGLLAAEIFGYSDRQHAEVRARSRHGLPAHQHHPRRRRRCPARPHLPADGRTEALRRAAPPTSSTPRYSDNFTRADGIPGRARREILRPGVRPVAGRRPQERSAPA